MVKCCCLEAKKRCRVCRLVPPFSIQSRQLNTCVFPPPKVEVRSTCCVSDFRMYYQRRDLPIAFEFDRFGMKLAWRLEIEKLDYHRYLPLFFEGLCENAYPYKIQARQGVRDLLEHGGVRVLPVIPQLIFPIKKALNTRIPEVLAAIMRAIQQLVKSCKEAGCALVPFFRQILPVFNEYVHCNVNCGDKVDTSYMRGQNAGDLIMETLEILERAGGEDAYINIKYMIPTYESCMLN